MRRTLAFLTVFLVASSAYGQGVTTSRPQITWIGLGRQGDASGSSGDIDRMGELALEPLRLSLMGNHPLTPVGGCGDGMAEAWTGASTLPAMRAFGTNLLGGGSSWKTPRLSLFGFSRVGCALDSAVGGAATFTVPLKPDVAFVLSAGAIYLPQAPPSTIQPNKSSTVRAGIVIRRANGTSFNVGIDTLVRGVSFGGIF